MNRESMDAPPSITDLAEEEAWIKYNHTRAEREALYLWWCKEEGVDPEDTQSMVLYEEQYRGEF